jgi:hypothetical protein
VGIQTTFNSLYDSNTQMLEVQVLQSRKNATHQEDIQKGQL